MQNQELHRIVASAIIVKPPHQTSDGCSEASSLQSERSLWCGGKDSKYLIAKRSPAKKAFPGLWTVPGGGIEVDDYINTPKSNSDCWYFALEKSLRREVAEEVGVEIGRVKYLLDLAFIRPDGIPVITLSFYCGWQSGEVKLNEENVDFRWVTFEEAKNYELCPGLLGELEMVDKILRGENPDNIIYNPNI